MRCSFIRNNKIEFVDPLVPELDDKPSRRWTLNLIESGTSAKTAANTIDLHVGHRLRNRREELGISRRALAREVGLSAQQLIKFERGINSMVASQLAEFSILLNVSPTYFFDFGARRHRVQTADRAAREVQALLRSYYQIRKLPIRLKIRDLVRALGGAGSRSSSEWRRHG